jgi:hypothetical protein
MFEMLSGLGDIWREIAHISELTGISVGVLVALAVLAYLDPTARAFAIRAAVLVSVAYASGLYENHVGRVDERAVWVAANAKIAKEAEARDTDAAKAAEAKYGPVIAARDRTIINLRQQVQNYARSIKSAPACPIGAPALRLRLIS